MNERIHNLLARRHAVAALAAFVALVLATGAAARTLRPQHAQRSLPQKTIGLVVVAGQAEKIRIQADAVRAGIKALGWKLQYGDANGDPQKAAQFISAMVASKVNGIITVTIEPATVSGALLDAKKANIPVVSFGI